MMPNGLRDSSPGAGPPQQGLNNPNNNMNNPYRTAQQQNRVAPPAMVGVDQELVDAPSGISPANSLRRVTRENRGSSGSLNELGILPQDPGAPGAARPSSRDRERRDTQKNGPLPGDKQEARKASGGNNSGPPNGAGPIRPSPYSFDSTSTLKPNHSSTDLLSLGSLRDSPSFDNSALAALDPLQNSDVVGGGGGASGSMAKKQGSGDSLDLPNGEHGGWVSYDSAEPTQRQDNRNQDWDRNKANPAFTNSRFSPDRFPVLQERDNDDEEIISLPRNSSQQPRPQHASQPVSVINTDFFKTHITNSISPGVLLSKLPSLAVAISRFLVNSKISCRYQVVTQAALLHSKSFLCPRHSMHRSFNLPSGPVVHPPLSLGSR